MYFIDKIGFMMNTNAETAAEAILKFI